MGRTAVDAVAEISGDAARPVKRLRRGNIHEHFDDVDAGADT